MTEKLTKEINISLKKCVTNFSKKIYLLTFKICSLNICFHSNINTSSIAYEN